MSYPSTAPARLPTSAAAPRLPGAAIRLARSMAAAGARAWQASRRRHQDRLHLLGMSTRELNDLGIGRSELDGWLRDGR